MVDSTNPRIMADNIKKLAANGGSTVEANPEGIAIGTLEKLGVDSEIYAIPKPLIYSITEQVVGKWIDGSDIYARTLDLSSNPVTVTAIAWSTVGTSTNTIRIIKCEGIEVDSGIWTSVILNAYFNEGDIKVINIRSGIETTISYFTIFYLKD